MVDDQTQTPNPIGQTGRGIEIRGRVEIATRGEPLVPGFGHETLDLHPHRIVTWNIGEFRPGVQQRPPHMQGQEFRDVSP